MGALENGESCLQADERRSGRVVQKAVQGFESETGEVAQLVGEGGDVFDARFADSISEGGLVAHPVVDGAAVDAGVAGGGSDGAALREQGEGLELGWRQVGIRKNVGIR
jgi:hypothetical protein